MNKQLKAIIVDDETNARLSLRGVLEEYITYISIADEAKDIPDAVKAIHKHKPDIVFLDIEMPGYSGLSLLDFFDKDAIDFKIIFVTAYSEYAINAFEISAVDYILKPIRKEHLERALNKLQNNTSEKLSVLRDNLYNPNDKKISLQTSEGLFFIKLDDVIYLKADGSYTHIFLSNGQKITNTKRLNEYERLESAGRFLRIHRSHIINLNHISKILKQDGGTVVMSNGDMLSVSADKKQQLMNAIDEERF
jgi:two-component system LytT family response regulator